MPRKRPVREVGFLIYPDFQIVDTAGPLGAFEMPSRGQTPPLYNLRVLAMEPGPVRSSSGATMVAERASLSLKLDTLIVSGGVGVHPAKRDPRTIAFVRAQAQAARRVCSVCSGAYVLAEAGLLKGKRATTHWRASQHFADRYPDVKLEADRIYTRDGRVWTSAGVTAGIDLALALIADDLGEDASRAAAQELVVYHRRPGGQSQFSALLEIDRAEGRFAELLGWMRERLDEPLTVEQLADQSSMSPRNFARAFAAEMGVTPAKAVERLRLESAREQVEQTPEPIELIATATGFGDPERMRRAFLRAFGQPPQAMRRLARTAA